MKTIKLPYKIQDQGFFSVLKELQKKQSTIYRSSYKLAFHGLAEKEIEADFKKKFVDTDSWILRSATKKGIGQFKADFELHKKNPLFKLGKRIFGGRRNFFRRKKGLITKEEYQENRLENYYSIGEANEKGNRKFEFNANSIIFKPKKGIKFEIELPTLRGKYIKDYLSLIEATENKAIPVTISLNKDHIFLSFEEKKLETYQPPKIIKGRYLGIDLNPNYIGVSFFDEHKRLLNKQLFNLKELTGKNINTNKLKHEIREIAIAIGKEANHLQIEHFFVEDLSFKQGDKKKGKSYNRLTNNQFLINEFNRMLSKFGKVIKVNAAYSSTIGNILHTEHPDPIAASMEIARRGIESRIKKGSMKFYPAMVDIQVLRNRWKEELIPEIYTWKELHDWLKATGLKYRVPIPEIGMFRIFSSRYSKVYVY